MSDTKLHRNHTITLQPDWQFHVTGPEFDDSKYSIRFASYHDAMVEIDKRCDETLRHEARNIKFRATILTADGEVKEITAINRRDGTIAGVEGREVYPNLPWVRATLQRLKGLRLELAKSEAELSKIKISTQRGYRPINPESYPAKVEQLKADIAQQMKLAEELTPPEAEAKPQAVA